MGVTKAVPVAARQWHCAGPWRGQRATVNNPPSGEPAQGKAHLCIHVWVIRYLRDMYMYMYICMYSTFMHVHATQRRRALKQLKIYNSSNNVRFRNSETLMCCPLFVRKVCWCRHPSTASSTRRVIVLQRIRKLDLMPNAEFVFASTRRS